MLAVRGVGAARRPTRSVRGRSRSLLGRRPLEVRQTDVKDRAMTQDDINNGRLVCVIAIAPGKPAEFVIFRIQQAQGEALDQPATRADQISRSRIRTSVRS
jgi:hypothetical protein